MIYTLTFVDRVRPLLLIIFFSSTAAAQLIDSLPYIIRGKRRIDARIESRISFINNNLINVTGVRAGVSFQKQLRVGAGVSWLSSRVPANFTAYAPDGTEFTEEKYLKFIYASFYADFVFHKTKRWQLSVPIQIGVGSSWFQRREDYHWGTRDKKYFMLLYEPGITVHFKVFKWFGLGTDVAYRFTLYNNKTVADNLNSPTYAFKLLFWPDELYFIVFPESGITKKYGPGGW
jgi:hypothetical protein